MLLFSVGCKKNSGVGSSSGNANGKGVAIVFTNGSDTRLAEIDTKDSQKIVFYGERNTDGSPKRLRGYTVTYYADLSKSDYVDLDSSGRYANIFLKSGEAMHFDYSQPDSVSIFISGLDSLGNQSNIKVSSAGKHPISNVRNATGILGVQSPAGGGGSDRNIDVWITKKDTLTTFESTVVGDDVQVAAHIFVGDHSYELRAYYNSNNGYYSVPLTSAGIEFNDPNAFTKTMGFISDQLDKICLDPTGVQGSTIQDIIKENVCPLSGFPAAGVICAAARGVIIICNIQSFISAISSFDQKIESNMNYANALVSVSCKHYKYGERVSNSMSVADILSNNILPDFKIVYIYKPSTPVGDSCAFTVVYPPAVGVGTWNYGSTGFSSCCYVFTSCGSNQPVAESGFTITVPYGGELSWQAGPVNDCSGKTFDSTFLFRCPKD